MSRGWMVRAYGILMPLAALSVVVQAVLFGGWYSEFEELYRDAHLHLGSASVAVVAACLALAMFGRFPSSAKIMPLTGLLVVLWIGQYLLGQYTDPHRWFSFIHVPLAFVVFGMTLILSARAHRIMAGRYADTDD